MSLNEIVQCLVNDSNAKDVFFSLLKNNRASEDNLKQGGVYLDLNSLGLISPKAGGGYKVNSRKAIDAHTIVRNTLSQLGELSTTQDLVNNYISYFVPAKIAVQSKNGDYIQGDLIYHENNNTFTFTGMSSQNKQHRYTIPYGAVGELNDKGLSLNWQQEGAEIISNINESMDSIVDRCNQNTKGAAEAFLKISTGL